MDKVDLGRKFQEGKGEPDRSILGCELEQDRCAAPTLTTFQKQNLKLLQDFL